MQIVWNKDVAEKLMGSHTVVELETFEVEDQHLTAYCVVPPEKVINDIAQLDNLLVLHAEFVTAMNKGDFKLCADIAEHLQGRFGGELDTFYEEILSRFK